jgi:hypothetical protein
MGFSISELSLADILFLAQYKPQLCLLKMATGQRSPPPASSRLSSQSAVTIMTPVSESLRKQLTGGDSTILEELNKQKNS